MFQKSKKITAFVMALLLVVTNVLPSMNVLAASFSNGQTVGVTQLQRASGQENGHFSVAGASSYGYCAQNKHSFWGNGQTNYGPAYEWDDATVRKILYYGPNGPGYAGPYYGSVIKDIDYATYAVGYINGECMNNTKAKAYINYVSGLADPISSGYKAYKVDITAYYNGNLCQDVAFLAYVPTKGNLTLVKSSANPDLTNGNSCYSLEGAVYGVYSNSACTAQVGTLTTNVYGSTNTLSLDAGTYYVKEITAPKGYKLDTQVHPISVSANSTATLRVSDYPENDPLAISITKINPDGVELSNVPSLAGAQFTVNYYGGFYTEENLPEKPTRSWVIETKEIVSEGKSYFIAALAEEFKVSGDDFYYDLSNPDPILPLGTLSIEETKPAPGYTLEGGYLQQMGSSDKITGKYVTQIKDSNSGISLEGGNEFTIGNYVLYGGIEVQKQDVETKSATAQGSASLAGAKFEIRSLNQDTIKIDGKIYSYGDLITTLETDENGYAATDKRLLPYGKYEVTEVEAPKGYLLDGENLTQTVTVSAENSLATAEITYDQVIRGDLELVKFREIKNNGQTTKEPLEGIVFEITSKTTRETVEIKTNKNGKASTSKLNSRGGLAYDTYVVHEANTPYGLKPIEDFEITISEDGEVIDYIVENKLILSPVKLVKEDMETGKTIPVADAEFQLLDADKNPIEITTYYPKKVVHKTFKTDEDGTFLLPDSLTVGTYYFREIQSPEGYLLNEEDVKFEITKEHDWDNPFVVKFQDAPAKGNIQITKKDESTDKVIPTGATFEVYAAEDIVTPDGTVRVEKGTLVDTVTTGKDGTAVTKELYLGKYVIKEIKAPEGYLLNQKEHKVTLEYKDQNTPVVTGKVTVKNQPAMGRIEVVKKDATTDKVIPTGATFEIIAAEDIVTPDGTVRLEKGDVADTVITDENGTVLSKELYLGKYVVKETKAPEGYLLYDGEQEAVLRYVDQNTAVVSDSVTFANEPAMGEIKIIKTDKETGDVLSDAVFEIRAAKNIVTPDGTIRVEKGMVVDTVTTNAEGIAISKKLHLGDYEVTEKVQPTGYLLSDEVFDVSLSYKNQKTSVVTEKLSVENIPTHLRVIKTDADSKEPLKDVVFQVWKKDTETEADAKEYMTDEAGQIDIKRFGAGVYCFQEIKTLPGYVLDETIYEMEISETGLVDGKSIGILEIGNVATKLIGTKAVSKDTGSQEAIPKEEAVIVDTVEFQDLQVGQEYIVKGILMDKSTGKALLVDEKEVTAETTFTAEEKDGTVDVVFSFDASGLSGQHIVVFEKVFIDDIEILAHEDIDDEAQTIVFPESMIQTSAKEKETGKQEVVATGKVTIIDTVSYQNLIVGQEYTVKGILMDKATGKPLLINGKEVTAETTFVPKEKDGTVDVSFTFDAGDLSGKSVVVFETLYVQDTEVASHADLNDKAQTILFKEQVKTGDSNSVFFLFLLFAGAGFSLVLFGKHRFLK